MPRGTEIVLHLKPDAKRFLEPGEIERIVKTYSDHVQFPIELVDEKGETRQINTASALWQRPKADLKPEDYAQAYRSITGAFDEPAMTLHYKAEGRHLLRGAAVCALDPAVRPVRSGAQGPGQALCAARLHHRRRRPLAALSALHARRGRQRGSAAQHLARDAAERSAGGADPQGADQPRPHRAANAGRKGCRRPSRRSGTLSAACSRRASTRISSAASSCSRSPASRPPPARPLAQAICRGSQPNQTEIYYLVGESPERSIQSEARSRPRARDRGSAADRSGGCVLDRGTAGNSRASHSSP